MSYPKGVIINNIVSDIKSKDYEKIYADIIGFKTPYEIGIKGDEDSGFRPDIICEKEDEINLFSIETNIDKRVTKKDIRRWKLFRIFAKANNGTLFLAGTKYNLSIIEKTLDPLPQNVKFIHLL